MKKKFGLRALALLLSLLMLGSLTGCAEQNLKETNRLNIYNLVDDSNPLKSNGFYTLVTYDYQKTYPDVGIDYRTSDLDHAALTYGGGITDEMAGQLQEYYDTVSINIMKGNCEDVIIADTYYQWFTEVSPPDYSKMIRSGAFIDLKPYLAEYAPNVDLSRYDSMQVDGKLYAVPVYYQPYHLFSLEEMLKRWGFELDTEDTILEFLRKCAAWQDEHADEEDAPVVFSKQAWEYIYMHISNIVGLDIVDYQNRTANFNNAEMQEILELLFKLKSDVAEPLIAQKNIEDFTQIKDKILFGVPNSTYSSNLMRSQGYNYMQDQSVIMPLRQMDGKVACYSDAYLMVPINAENKLNAVKYVACVLEAVYSVQMYEGKIGTNVPNRNTALAFEVDEENLKLNIEKRSIQKFYMAESQPDTILDMYHNQGDICMPSCWFHKVKHRFDSYMRGEMSIDELMADVQSRLQIYVSE